jgi:protein gp37
MADWMEDRRELDAERERLGALVMSTPSLDWQLLTKRPENLARLSPWPAGMHPGHAWVGTTVEHDATRARLDALCAYPAAIRFVSAEPLVGDLDLRPWLDRLHWVIVGGESGPGHRRMDLAAAERIVRHCTDAGVAVFVKQDSGPRSGQQGRVPDEWFVRQFPHTPSSLAAA